MSEAERSGVCGLHLNASEREQISIGLAQGRSIRVIGKQLNRPASTISREKLRHQVAGDREDAPRLYQGYWAQQQAVIAKRRCGRKRKLDLAGEAGACVLSDHVRTQLRLGWSPKSIACRLKQDYPNDEIIRDRPRLTQSPGSTRHFFRTIGKAMEAKTNSVSTRKYRYIKRRLFPHGRVDQSCHSHSYVASSCLAMRKNASVLFASLFLRRDTSIHALLQPFSVGKPRQC